MKNNKKYNLLKKKINLKKLSSKDINHNYLNWLNDKRVTRFTDLRFQKKHTFGSIRKFVKEINLSKNDFLYGVFFKENNEEIHVGNVKIGQINYYHKFGDISFLIGNKSFWNRGLATVAVSKGIVIAKNKFKLKKLTAGAYENNHGSIKVLKNNNFKIEGVVKKKIYYQRKRFNHLIFGLNL